MRCIDHVSEQTDTCRIHISPSETRTSSSFNYGISKRLSQTDGKDVAKTAAKFMIYVSKENTRNEQNVQRSSNYVQAMHQRFIYNFETFFYPVISTVEAISCVCGALPTLPMIFLSFVDYQ